MEGRWVISVEIMSRTSPPSVSPEELSSVLPPRSECDYVSLSL